MRGYEQVLSPAALQFLVQLHERFSPEVAALLERRQERQQRFDAGELPDFLPETAALREAQWRVAEIPQDLLDRRVEITGPVDRKMIINALNSGARVYMADFEDSHAPTWVGTLEGQRNLFDAVRRNIDYISPEGKHYRLGEQLATLMVRPRGWHLPEKHLEVHGSPIPAALFDFGLFFFHNARELIARGTGPYFYLPKLESHLEARLWNRVFEFSQDQLGIPRGTVRATVLIETIPAAFEMDEILYELREHVTGLNCGRWDYIFSFIKKFRNRGELVLPERGQVGMTTHFLHSYSRLLIKTCHRRGAFAMGGMAAQIPVKGDPAANDDAFTKVEADKQREAGDGHDGTWVAHPGLVPLAMRVFDQHLSGPNQLDRRLEEVQVSAGDLLRVPQGSITEPGLRNNLYVAVSYLGTWLDGQGAVPIHNLMEDAATAEIARAQLWQWIRHDQGVLDDGRRITGQLVRRLLAEERARIREEVGEAVYRAGQFERAAEIIDQVTGQDDLVEFLTLEAYPYLS
jgi:malate synthase